jgi:hypothetical protein
MAHAKRKPPPHRSSQRTDRLLLQDRRRVGCVDKLPPLVPVVCRGCDSMIGLAEVDELLFCVDCGLWAEPIEDLAVMTGMLT